MTASSIQSRIVVIAGPTASGKSGLALGIAEILKERNRNGVILCADSQQLYRELRIVTARPTPQEEARIPHKLYGVAAAQDACSAGQWLKLARMEIDWALQTGALPIVVGGTGLYLRALLEGIADMPDVPPMVRAQAQSDYQAMGKDAFAARLREVDPAFFERLKVQDRQRLLRAWEIWLASGRPLSWWQDRPAAPPYAVENIVLWRVETPREELYARIDTRFSQMLEQGALEEVRQLTALDLPAESPILKSLGVRELTAHLRGECSLAEAVQAAVTASRQYAKRQLTWLRHQLPPHGAVTRGDARRLADGLVSS